MSSVADPTGATPEPTCAQMEELVPELALGTLDGRQRAAAMAHVAGCSDCRHDLRRHSDVLDELLATVPAVEPAAGFETRVLERIAEHGHAPPGRCPAGAGVAGRSPAGAAPRHRPRRALVAAAAAVLGVAIGAGAYRVGAVRSHSVELRQGTLVSAGRPVGVAYLYPGAHPWVYMGLTVGGGDTRLTCELVAGRKVVGAIGAFSLTAGHGHWGAPAPATGGTITGARLVDAHGSIVAAASFSR